MGVLLKSLAEAINRIDRQGAPPGTRRRRADGRVWVKQPDGSWSPEAGQEPGQQEPTPEQTAETQAENVLTDMEDTAEMAMSGVGSDRWEMGRVDAEDAAMEMSTEELTAAVAEGVPGTGTHANGTFIGLYQALEERTQEQGGAVMEPEEGSPASDMEAQRFMERVDEIAAQAETGDPDMVMSQIDQARTLAQEATDGGDLSPQQLIQVTDQLDQAEDLLMNRLGMSKGAGAMPFAPLGDDKEPVRQGRKLRRKAIPQPRGGESQDEFVSRCMSKLASTDADKPQDQRLAICFSTYRESKARKGEKLTAAELMKEAQQNAGWLVKLAKRLLARKQQPPARQEEVGTTGVDERIEGAPEAFTPAGIDKMEHDEETEKADGADHRMEGAPERMTEEVIDS